MKKSRRFKIMLLCLLMTLPLLLSGCYVTPEIDVDQTQGVSAGFPTYPVATQAPTAPPMLPTDASIVLNTGFPVSTDAGFNFLPTETPFAGGNGWTVIGGIATIPVISASTAPSVVTLPPSQPPTATPAASLKLGATGDQVRQVQEKLKKLGFYKGSVDGDFGEGTEKAVKDFQKQYKLTVDGKVGSQTMEKLASAKATAKPSATATPKKSSSKATAKPTAKPSYSSSTYLKLGSSGKQVTQMQQRLIQLGYLNGKATGQFDSATEAAVRAFQRRNCDYEDGIAGEQTLKALYSSSAKKTSSAAASIGTSLKEGSTGSDVRSLQSRLKTLGYYSGSADGVFGPGTTSAVKAFQRANGLEADGKAGGNTLLKLYSSSAKAAASTVVTKKPTSTPHRTATPLPTGVYQKVTTAPNGYATLRRGYYGTPVERMQKALRDQGYYDGSVDGYYGEGTEDAVRDFQRNHGLNTDGTAGPATLKVLYEGNFPSGS